MMVLPILHRCYDANIFADKNTVLTTRINTIADCFLMKMLERNARHRYAITLTASCNVGKHITGKVWRQNLPVTAVSSLVFIIVIISYHTIYCIVPMGTTYLMS